MKKSILSILLVASMMLMMVPTAFAAETSPAGYGGSELPKAPTVSGDVITVTPENAQYTLDGAYGSIDHKTIHFSTGDYKEPLILARPTKYEGSGTNYNKQTASGFEAKTISELQQTGVYWYDRTVRDVTFTADAGVVLPGFTAGSGHVYGTAAKAAYDYVRDITVLDTNNSHYASCSLENIAFQNLTISGQVWLNDYSASNYSKNAVNQNISFDGCTFLGNTDNVKDTSFAAIKTNADSKYFRNITVQNCSFKNYFQGIHIQGVDTVTIAHNHIQNTTHNAIALQSSKSNPAKGTVSIQENVMVGAKDRAIRFGDIDAGCSIAINNNVMASSGDAEGQLIKASSVPAADKVNLENNYWSGKALATAVQTFEEPQSVGVTGGTFLVNPSTGLVSGYTAVPKDGKLVVETLTADNAVAAIGSTIYGTLQQAVAAAQPGDTITLKRDIDWVRDTTVLDLSNKTLDLNRHTISALNFTLVFEGKNCVIRNGSLDSLGTSYALFIGENPTDNFLVEDVTAVGGINIFMAQNVVLRNVNATAMGYYAVWCDQGGKAVIENGTFQAVDKTTALFGMYLTDSLLEIKNGCFDAKDKPLVLQGNYNKPVISGGYFTVNPADYITPHSTVVASDKAGYRFMVVPKGETPAQVVPAAPEVAEPSLPSGASQAELDVAADVKDTLTATAPTVTEIELLAAANTVANNNQTTDQAGKEALAAAQIETENKTVTIVVQPYLDIAIQDVTIQDTSKTLTLDITPMYQKVATTADMDTPTPDIKVNKDGVADANAVILSTGKLHITEPVTVTIPLPAGFAKNGTMDVGHKGYVYTGTVTDNVLTFVNPHGFSLFHLGEKAVARIGETSYSNLQTALHDAKDGDTVLILKDGLTASMSGDTRTVTIQNDTNGAITVQVNGMDYALASKGDTVSVTYTRPSSSGPSTYTLHFSVNGGSVIQPLTVAQGTKIDLSAYVPTRIGYTFAGWYSDQELTRKVTSITLYDNATVYAKWTKRTAFADVHPNDWFADAAAYVFDKGLMNGTSETTFSPHMTTTRGMIVAILHRLEHEPAAPASSFTDVKAGAYYEQAINWAAANGIVTGVSETSFAPDQAITREQMAAILYRYAQFKGYDTHKANQLDAYQDAAQISAYAVPAMQWANAENLITGKSATVLDPMGNATRAEVASILMRFCENTAA